MLKAWSTINHRGFSPVEVLVAITVFGLLVTGLLGALVYGRQSTEDAGIRTRAVLLAEEGTEAVRNIRDAAYANLTDGTYGLAQSSNQWALSGSSDASGIYTRSITIAGAGTNRKNITSTVSWARPNGAVSQVQLATQLSNWLASIVPPAPTTSWTNPDTDSTQLYTNPAGGYKVATQGNYAYLVRNSSSPNFFAIDISNPASPSLVFSSTLAGPLTNIFVSGNYAYVTSGADGSELTILNITNPANVSTASTYNAPDVADANGVYVAGTTAYIVRDASSSAEEFIALNVSNPQATPTRIGGYSLATNMYEVYVRGTAAYVSTQSATQSVLAINLAAPSSPTLANSVNLPGTDALTIDGSGSLLVVGQGAYFYSISTASPLAPVVVGTVAMPLLFTSLINDIAIDSTHNLAFVATNNPFAELQIVSIATPTSPSIISSVDAVGLAALNGIAYNSTKDRAIGASGWPLAEFMIFEPN